MQFRHMTAHVYHQITAFVFLGYYRAMRDFGVGMRDIPQCQK